MGESTLLSSYISPITNVISNSLEKVVNSHPYYSLLYGIPIIFGFRQFTRFNKLAKLRFADIGYQIKRADSIRDRLTACKYFLIGTILVPITGCIITYKIYDNIIKDKNSINRLILYDLTKNIGSGIRASNDVNSDMIRRTMESNIGISESFRKMSKELKEDAEKVKNKFGLT